MKPFRSKRLSPVMFGAALVIAGAVSFQAATAHASYPGILAILLTGCSDEEDRKFEPNGVFEVQLKGDIDFESVYRDGSSSYSSGDLLAQLGMSTENRTFEMTLDRYRKTQSGQEKIDVDFGGQLSSIKIDRVYPSNGGKRAGNLPVTQANGGKLSEILGSEAPTSGDCNITIELAQELEITHYGEQLNIYPRETTTFDDSLSCQAALEELSDQIFETGKIPGIFLNAAFFGGLDLSRLGELRSISLSGVYEGVKIGPIESEGSDTGAPEVTRSQSARVASSPSMKKNSLSKLKGSPSVTKGMSAEVLKQY